MKITANHVKGCTETREVKMQGKVNSQWKIRIHITLHLFYKVLVEMIN